MKRQATHGAKAFVTGGSAILPAPEPPFRGVIGRKASESKPDFLRLVSAPEGAPNVLLILTDDTGFGASSTFCGVMRMMPAKLWQAVSTASKKNKNAIEIQRDVRSYAGAQCGFESSR